MTIDAGTDAGPDLPPGCNPPSLTYASFGMAFINNYCFRCHELAQSDIQQLSPTIADVAVTGGDGAFMPPSDPKPTLAERTNLGFWLSCGAP